MKTICINASHKYEVLIGDGLLPLAGEICAEKIGVCRGVVITDSNVDKLYSEVLISSLEAVGYSIKKFVFDAGEASKNADTLVKILEFLATEGLSRSDCVFALGGGVVGDMAGFAAAIYLRGIKFVQLPSTLLAATDSSVGGKTGIDLKCGKNLVGAFHQPALVICDYNLLKTLPEHYFADGSAEVIKYGIINDRALFGTVSLGISKNIEDIIASCVKNKRDIVEADEFDNGCRQLLNLGHTVGHAIEKLSDFTVSHGSAVAIGMVIITRAAVKMGFCRQSELDLIIELIEKNGLPTACPYSATELAETALSDKKRKGDKITLVVPYSVGDSRLLEIPTKDLEGFIAKGLL